MINEHEPVRINAWGPLKLYFGSYLAPDVATALIIYGSVFWAIILNFFINIFALLFLDASAWFFHVVLLISIVLSTLYNSARSIIDDRRFSYLPIWKMVGQILLITFSFLSCAIYVPTLLFLPDNSSFLAKLGMYGLVFPLFLTPVTSFLLAHIFSNLLRVLTRPL